MGSTQVNEGLYGMTTRTFLHEVYLSDFGNYVGLQDEGYFDALVRMFELVLKIPSVWPTRNASRYVISCLIWGSKPEPQIFPSR